MMIDFALDAERNEGKSPREAIHQAALLRFRPIIMTTLAALFGALPLMLGWGVGSELRHPLGISIVGGLIVSQALTLFTTPVIYLGFDKVARRSERAGTSARARPTRGSTRRRRRAGRRTREPLGPLHPPADRHHPADHRHRPGGDRGLFPAAGLAPAAGGLPHDLGARQPARREPGDHGHQRGHARWNDALGSSPTSPNDVARAGWARPTSPCSSASTATSTAPRATCRRRSTPRASICPSTLRSNPTYRKVNPADAPILILSPDVEDANARGRSTTWPRRSSSNSSAR